MTTAERAHGMNELPPRSGGTGAPPWQVVTADAAARLIQPGQRVLVGSACATPRTVLEALERLPVPTPGVTLVHALTDRVGVGDPPRCYYRDPRDGPAEVAYMVDPGWQGGGLATALHARTVEYARSHGVRGLVADVLTSNPAMLAVFRHGTGHDLRTDADAGVYEVRMMFTEEAVVGSWTPRVNAFRHVRDRPPGPRVRYARR